MGILEDRNPAPETAPIVVKGRGMHTVKNVGVGAVIRRGVLMEASRRKRRGVRDKGDQGGFPAGVKPKWILKDEQVCWQDAGRLEERRRAWQGVAGITQRTGF